MKTPHIPYKPEQTLGQNSGSHADFILDTVVIGAGVSGLIALKYLTSAGFNVVALEKAADVGGVWRQLPPWQDIQMSPEDWSINDVPIEGFDQKSILKNIGAFADQYNLRSFIRFQEQVQSLKRNNDMWVIQTNKGTVLARTVVCSTGAHNDPFIPEITRRQSMVREFHSARLMEPSILHGQRVVVVGGGTSAFDLIELALQQKAQSIHWVYRSVRWMFPTTKTKQEKASLRQVAYQQMIGAKPEKLTAVYRKLLAEKYRFFGIEDILPERPFDYERDQLVPGRRDLIQNFKSLRRSRSEIQEISGNTVVLKSGEKIEADVVLYGTGYHMNLKYLGLPEFATVKDSETLRGKCYGLMQAPNYPQLYFLGGTALELNGVAPLNISMMARTLVSVIKGKCKLPQQPITQKINHWHLIQFFSRFDHTNYLPFFWRLKYFLLARHYLKHEKAQIRFDK